MINFCTSDIEAQKCRTFAASSNPSSPTPAQDTICLPIYEFGAMMRDITLLLESNDKSLEKMLITFEQMAYYMDSKTYIAIVESKEYKVVDSVRTLFRLLAPCWKPVDCSLLIALVHAAGCDKAMHRLKEYLQKSDCLMLGKGGKSMYVPHEFHALPQDDCIRSSSSSMLTKGYKHLGSLAPTQYIHVRSWPRVEKGGILATNSAR